MNQFDNASVLFRQLAPSIQNSIQTQSPFGSDLIRSMTNQAMLGPNFMQLMQRSQPRAFVSLNSPVNAYNSAMGTSAAAGQNLRNRMMIPLNASIQNSQAELQGKQNQNSISQSLAELGDNQYLSSMNQMMNQRNQGMSQLMAMLSPMFQEMFKSA